jgi:hypothetical protein
MRNRFFAIWQREIPMRLRNVAGRTGFFALCLLTAGSAGFAQDAESPAAEPKAPETIIAPFADHYSMRIEKPADVVWQHLKRLYIDGERMREQGFAVTRVTDDPKAWLGAVRGVHATSTARPEVTIMVSGIDEEARLLTLTIVLENPVPAYVIHQVRPDGPEASIYQTIIQTGWPVKKPEGGELTAEYIREKMQADVAFHNKEVAEIMQRQKAIIEALD